MYLRRNSLWGKTVLPIIVVFILLVTTSGVYGHYGAQIIKIGAGEIAYEEMITEIHAARAVFVGEEHINKAHHMIQLKVISSLYEKGLPMAVGLEMFTARDQQKLDDWVYGGIAEADFIRDFSRNWGFSWHLYRDIFLYARKQGIPLIGLNVPRRITRKVARHGFESLSDNEISMLPPGITCDLDQRYMDYVRRLFHFKGGTDRTFINFCEAQVIWDQTMAYHLARYLQENPERTIVALSGSVHAWKLGIPKQLKKYLSVKERSILPNLPGDYRNITKEDADYLVLH